MKITFEFLEEHNYPSVTDYCRYLIKQETYPKKLEVWRGTMPCLYVYVEKAALVTPGEERGWRKFHKSRRKPALQPRTAI